MGRRQRNRVVFTPQWSGAIEGWTRTFIKANNWRCDRIHTPADLLQDAYITFLKISERYPRVIDAPHFMRLYQRTIWNQMHDQARYMRRKRVLHEDTTVDAPDLLAGRIGEVSNSGYLGALLHEAPEELKLALALLAEHPEALRDTVRTARQPRENLNMKLRRVLGLTSQFDFVGAVQALLKKES